MRYNINDIHIMKLDGVPFIIVPDNLNPSKTDAIVIKAHTTFNNSDYDILNISQKVLDDILESSGDKVEIITKEQVEKNRKEFEDMELMR